jgi:hypothetical protein
MSTAKFSTWLNPDGTENYKCRAWVNFNGTGTVAIRAAGNVASITDNGTGDYTVNFTTAMPDVNYSFNGTSSDDATAGSVVYLSGTWATNGLVGSIRIRTVNNLFSATDRTFVAISVFR